MGKYGTFMRMRYNQEGLLERIQGFQWNFRKIREILGKFWNILKRGPFEKGSKTYSSFVVLIGDDDDLTGRHSAIIQ